VFQEERVPLEQQASPRQPQRAGAQSMSGLKAQLHGTRRQHKTAALSASPACVRSCHFAVVSDPALGLVLEHSQGQGATAGAGFPPSRHCAGRAGGSHTLPHPLEGRRLKDPLVSVLTALAAQHFKHPQHCRNLRKKLISSAAGKGWWWHISLYCISRPCFLIKILNTLLLAQ